MDRLNWDNLNALLTPREFPCVSVLMQTQRGGSEEDLLRCKELLNDAEQRLTAAGIRTPTAHDILAPARKLLTRSEFWRSAIDGLAIYLASGLAKFFRLPLRLPNRVAVEQRFVVRHVLPWVLGDGKFFVLALSQNQVSLLEGTAHAIQPVPVPSLAGGLAEARQGHDRDEPLNLHTHASAGGRGVEAVFHGQGVGIDDQKEELRQYCIKIDRALHDAIGQERAPLVIAAVDYLVPIYRKANRYPNIAEAHIKGNPDHMSAQQLHDQGWAIVEPLFREQTTHAVEQYRRLAGTGRTTDDLDQLLPALHRGEIETLLVAGNEAVWGRFDRATNQVQRLTEAAAQAEDLVNLAVVDALRRGRRVHLVDPVPGLEHTPLAGIYFVPMAKHRK